MNKLTTISTIKKAAPLALLAVVMSGSAFAQGKGQNNGSDKGRKGEPQGSLSVVTTCSLCGDPSAPDFDPAKYVDCEFSKSDPALHVAAKITDETGDVYDPVDLGIEVDANVQRKDKGGPNSWVGIPDMTGAVSTSPGTWTTVLYPCRVDPTINTAKAFSAIVNAEITAIDASRDIYTSRCENIDADDPTTTDIDESQTEADEDEIDQSDFDVKALGITC
jgi:hypothetical protein